MPQIAYRAGRHASFMESLTARLSSADYPALSPLTTREDSDTTLALFDAMASSLDVLTFYTERYANEHYLRTATERLSVIEMARLIGYRPAPGVAASTHLAFTLQDLPGAPSDPITIPVGTKVQSVPGQDEVAQTFETVEPAPARAAWNAVPAQAATRWVPASGDTSLWLAGLATGLEPGDAILIVGTGRMGSATSDAWQVRILTAVTPDNGNGRTMVEWADPLTGDAPDIGVEVYAFRQRAALFGHNAPDPNLFSTESNIIHKIDMTTLSLEDFSIELGLGLDLGLGLGFESASIEGSSGTNWTWKNFSIGSTVDIDPQNEKIVAGSWVAMVSNGAGGTPDLPGVVGLYRATRVLQMSRQDFAISSKITRVTPDAATDSAFGLRATLVLAQSERLETVDTPLFHPVHGDVLTLGRRVAGLVPGQPVALTGKRQPVAIAAGVTGLELLLGDGDEVPLTEGDRLVMIEPAVKIVITMPPFGFPGFSGLGGFPGFGGGFGGLFAGLPLIQIQAMTAEEFAAALGEPGISLGLKLMDRDGRTGTLLVAAEDIALAASEKDDETVREIAFIADGIESVDVGRDHTVLALAKAMQHVYERATLRLNANVAPATHGETVEAILGDGDGRHGNQRVRLNQQPLTYVSASTSSGRASTLDVRVNDVLWSEQPTLYGAEPRARVYETLETDAGFTTVQFGDGVEGARLPSGATNVRARYRKGIGVGGNVGAGKLTTLLSRPLGVAEAVNPSPATGGEDPEALDRARDNAPLTVLTLDRAVSIADYRNYARAFAGIGKAHALWIPSGIARGVFLTIAGVGGAEVPETSKTYESLADSLATYGDPLVPIRIVNHLDSRFRIKAAVKVLGTHLAEKVLPAVEAALRDHFAFAARAFGQTVAVDEVAAVAQGVDGVEAAHVIYLYREGEAATLAPRIFARLPVASLTALPEPAELLTLTDDPVELDVMS
ncbi:MAG TPA: putative baseplate assembly protein [Candidatus Limnocylindria bacterium]|nr:putative baseplate assembly protein [Candidatus Limnocylindria bacterium]